MLRGARVLAGLAGRASRIQLHNQLARQTYSGVGNGDNRSILEPENFVAPQKQDILLNDVKTTRLTGDISNALHVKYLSDVAAGEEPRWPVTGVLYGQNHRVMVNLHVERNRKKKNVFFLVDTGSPSTFMSANALLKFGLEIVAGDAVVKMKIHGLLHDVSLSHDNFEDVCVLGADYLHSYGILLSVDYLVRQNCTLVSRIAEAVKKATEVEDNVPPREVI